MAGKIKEEELKWSSREDPYSIRKIHDEIGLPVLVYVQEGIYSCVESNTFSGGDYLKLHGCETLEKVVAYPTDVTDGKFSKYYKQWHKPLEIPLDYRVKARVIPKHGQNRVYPAVSMMIEDFPRCVKTGQNIIGMDKNKSSVLVPAGSKLELLRIAPSENGQRLVCSFRDKEVILRMDCQGRFSIVPDETAYSIRDIVSRLPLPQLISLEDDGVDVKKYLSEEAKQALANIEHFKGNFVLDKLFNETVVYGTHRLDYSYFQKIKNAKNRLQAIVVIPLDSDATFQVALNRESSIYESVFALNYITTIKTSKLVPISFGQHGERNRSLHIPWDDDDGDSPSGKSAKPPVSPRTVKPRALPKSEPIENPKQADGGVVPSDSDTSTGSYEEVTPDLTSELPPDYFSMTGRGETAGARPKRVSSYEIWGPSITVPDPGPPPRPQRSRVHDSVHLPLPIPKPKKQKRLQKTVSSAIDIAKKGAKNIIGTLQRTSKDKPGISSPVEEYPATFFSEEEKEGSPQASYRPTDRVNHPTPLEEVDESSDENSDREYQYPDVSKMDLSYLPQSEKVKPSDTDEKTKSLDRRELPRTPEALDKISHSAPLREPPRAYIKPMHPVKTLYMEGEPSVIQEDTLLSPARVIHPVKPMPANMDTQLTNTPAPRTPSPGVALPGLTKKTAAPTTAPKPARKPGQIQSKADFTKANSVSRDEVRDFSVDELLECLKKLGLGEKVKLFSERKVDGELFLRLKEETFRNEYNLTDTELLNINRFQNEGKIPKTSHS